MFSLQSLNDVKYTVFSIYLIRNHEHIANITYSPSITYSLGPETKLGIPTLSPTESCQACHHEFRWMLSAKGARLESNNQWKSDLIHVGRRFVGGWGSGYVWYLELSCEPKHIAQQMRYQNVDLSNGHCLGTIIIF